MRWLLVLTLVTGALLLYASDAITCGDKFLVVGRGIRYERAYAAAHPGSILVYTNDAKLSKELQTILKKSGHKIQTAENETTLFTNLKSTKYDLVLVSLKDVARLESNVRSTTHKPSVLPVVYNATGSEWDAAKKQHVCILKHTNKIKNTVALIDEVMEARKKGKPVICKKT